MSLPPDSQPFRDTRGQQHTHPPAGHANAQQPGRPSGELPAALTVGVGPQTQPEAPPEAPGVRVAPPPGHPAPSGSSSKRKCFACGEQLTGQFVRALEGTFHLDCFKCRDCGATVAAKFFPVDDEDGGPPYPLCEKDYFRRLDLLCHDCGEALRGSYITALDRKYHIEHFTCCVCPTVFGPQDSYYEHDGKVYCHYHYSTQFASKCNGCQTAILKQFVEIFRNGQNQHWHPECYMIHKFWNVRLAPHSAADDAKAAREDMVEAPSNDRRSMVRDVEEKMEEKVYQIWSVLSSFEESSAACISDMLLHVSNGAYIEGVFVAERFIWHVEILFLSADSLDAKLVKVAPKGLVYSRESKLLCKKIVAFFHLLSKSQEGGVRRVGVTQELLSLVTGLAHYLKLLIRISLQGALKLERDFKDGEALPKFLQELSSLDAMNAKQTLEATQGDSENLADQHSDICTSCRSAIEEECARYNERRWHMNCLVCANCQKPMKAMITDALWSEGEHRLICRDCSTKVADAKDGMERITRLKQYVFLLRVALARLLVILRQGGTLPHTSDDPNLQGYDNEDHKSGNPPLLRSESRSKSFGGEQTEAYTNTVNDIRRLRSTRLDRQLGGSSQKRPRQSRIIEGPEADSVRPGAEETTRERRKSTFRIIEDRDITPENIERSFGDDKALTLDDIPRIVAAEQAREQRPNAFKHSHRTQNYAGPHSPAQPRLVNGHSHQRDDGPGPTTARGANNLPQELPPPTRKRYFSELTALEIVIIRHIAVMNIFPLVKEYFDMEELLGLIDSNKKTFWGRFGEAFRPGEKKKMPKKRGCFGIPLESLTERDGAESSLGVGPGSLRIPQFVDDAVGAMRQMDMSVEGVFRKNGNIRRLNTLAESLDKAEGSVDLLPEGPVQVAALLKKFLRELPDPLLTFKLHKLFITSQKLQDEDTKRRVLHLSCCLLPKSHRDCMEILFSFLNWTASFSHIDEESGSKMDIHNLSTVITPNILYSKNKEFGMDDSFLAIEAVHTMIEYNERMSEIPEDLLSLLDDPTLFSQGTQENMTTKEFLKRYGDIINRPPPKQHHIVTTSPPRSRDGRTPTAPVFQRVDTDPTQSHAWERESSAKPLGMPGPAPSAQIPHNGPQVPPNTYNPSQPRGHTRMRSAGSIQDEPPLTVPNGARNESGPRPPIGAG
ncbi:RhoGAP-domain-containing protein [Ascodesmis nigricans]|uniref:RhoGAP-domain-containing protein n=1 Tax=Ascodesmis nigricans TaxID=341454 RepID=A0A4S2MRD2_9PEZI|nr:RhoGAP-domain-containing protein [Ascodesmis nigricans]